MPGFHCAVCGQYHEELPLSYGSPSPDAWFALPSKERDRRAVITSDQCIVDNKFFFLAGNIDIPIIDSEDVFSWTVWISVSKANFDRAEKLWEKPGRETELPYFGWLNTILPVYPATLNLKVNLHTRPVGQRPFVELEPTDHPLAVEQRDGITRQRVEEIARMILHS